MKRIGLFLVGAAALIGFGGYRRAIVVAAGAPAAVASEVRQTKVEARGTKSGVHDESKPVRKELDRQYARLAEAIRNKDFHAFQALHTADFTGIDAQGRKQFPQQMADRARLFLQRIRPPIRASFAIEAIALDGGDARATVRQSISRMQKVAGEFRKVETSSTQDETWTKTPEGWKLKLAEGERDLEWHVDDKRIEPGKPYDPAAPPYVPTEPAGQGGEKPPN